LSHWPTPCILKIDLTRFGGCKLFTIQIQRKPVGLLNSAFLTFANGVRNSGSIKELSLSHLQMRFKNVQALMLAVTNHPMMQKLTIGEKYITTGYDEIKFIAEEVLPDLQHKRTFAPFSNPGVCRYIQRAIIIFTN
jgi:hypothetical protein